MTNYDEAYTKLHSEDASFGTSGILIYRELDLCINALKPKTILDFGCGKGALVKQLKKQYPNLEIHGYDPYNPEYSTLKKQKYDLVINTDVLEHIPEENVESVIKQISLISKNVFFQFHHYPAVTILPNGENAHCTVKPVYWYTELLNKYFKDILVFPGATCLQTLVLTFKVPQSICELLLKDKNIDDDLNFINKKIQLQYIKRQIFIYRLLSIFSKNKKNRYCFYIKCLKKILGDRTTS